MTKTEFVEMMKDEFEDKFEHKFVDKFEAKFEDNIGAHSSIPNNEQHEIPILKKQSKDQLNNRTSSHNKFLKDTPIDQEMLTKNHILKSINATKAGSNKQNDASNKDHFQSQNHQ